MPFFHSSKNKNKAEKIPRSALRKAGEIPVEAKYDTRRGKFKARLCANKSLQYFLLIMSVVFVLMYIYMSMLTISSIAYNVKHNTDSYKTETVKIGVTDYEIHPDSTLSFHTADDLEYKNEKIEFVVVDSSVIAEDEAFYIPADSVIAVPLSKDFALNFLNGNRVWIVAIYTLLFELLCMYMARADAEVMKRAWVNAISKGMVVLMVLLILLCFILFT